MDYKINKLTKEVACSEMSLQDIPQLRFGIIETSIVFDATFYCDLNKAKFDVKMFSRSQKLQIQTLAQAQQVSIGQLFFENTNGHVLINRELVFLFLAYVNPDMLIYFNQLVSDAITEGIALSDGYIASVINAKVPNEVLKNIIESRMNEQKERQS